MGDSRRVVLHLVGEAAVDFAATDLWPSGGEYSHFGIDLPAFAQEVMRRLQGDGYVGYGADGEFSVFPLSAIRRIDFRLTD